jgi:hypothetical protein
VAPLAVLALWCASGAALAGGRDDEIQVIIVAGDTDPAAAARKLEAWSASLATKPRVLHQLPPGYPKLVHSADYPGLQPGLDIAIAGFCRKREVQPVLSSLRAVEPGTYARTVSVGPDALACPFHTLQRYLAAGYVESKGGDRTPKQLKALALPATYPGKVGTNYSVIIAVVDDGGRITDEWTATAPLPVGGVGDQPMIEDRQARPDGEDFLVVVKTSLFQSARMCEVDFEHTYRMALKDGALRQLSYTKGKVKTMCGE